jgi:hypothetical protein
VDAHKVFQYLIAISALPGELMCSTTTWSSPQVPGCGMQVAATPKYVIIICAYSSRSAVFWVCYCVLCTDVSFFLGTACSRNKTSQQMWKQTLSAYKSKSPICVLLKLSGSCMFSNLCYKYFSKQQTMLNRTHEGVAQQMYESAHTGSNYGTRIWKLLLLAVNTICMSLTGTQKQVQVEEKTAEVEKWWAGRHGLRAVYFKNVFLVTGSDCPWSSWLLDLTRACSSHRKVGKRQVFFGTTEPGLCIEPRQMRMDITAECVTVYLRVLLLMP